MSDQRPTIPSSSSGDQTPPSGNEIRPAIVPGALQRRNQLCFTAIRMLLYLAAPLTYSDVMQATLCDKLGASKTIANLPSSLF